MGVQNIFSSLASHFSKFSEVGCLFVFPFVAQPGKYQTKPVRKGVLLSLVLSFLLKPASFQAFLPPKFNKLVTTCHDHWNVPGLLVLNQEQLVYVRVCAKHFSSLASTECRMSCTAQNIQKCIVCSFSFSLPNQEKYQTHQGMNDRP